MICSACESFKQRPNSGAYRMQCLACCVRLVLSARPIQEQEAVMLDAIARYPDAPKREQITAAVKVALRDGNRTDDLHSAKSSLESAASI